MNLLNDIRIAQRNAGESVVIQHLESTLLKLSPQDPANAACVVRQWTDTDLIDWLQSNAEGGVAILFHSTPGEARVTLHRTGAVDPTTGTSYDVRSALTQLVVGACDAPH